MANSDMVQSVLKALDLFTILARDDRSLRLSDLADLAGLKPPACRNLLRSLMARGFVMQDENGGYLVGPALDELSRNSRNLRIMRLAEHGLRELEKAFPDCVLTFSELTADVIRCRLRMSPDRPGELQHPEGYTFPPYSTVTSRCLQSLAVHAPDYEENFPFEEFGALFFPSEETFLLEREEIRKRGYAERHSSGQNAAAFFFPDHYVFGISRKQMPPLKPDMIKPFIDRLRREAEETPS